jgi:ATP-dependent DNA ligase
LVANQDRKTKRLWSVWHAECLGVEAANEVFQKLLADGHEGIILKDKSGKWEDKRTKSQIKFKGELECDLKIVALQEGTGKYENMLGAIICESADGVVKVSVGSGFNDAQRQSIGNAEIGKIVAVKYNARITNKQGEQSLFLPIFVEVRYDKEVADASKDIK